jgi:hypothetical protein
VAAPDFFMKAAEEGRLMGDPVCAASGKSLSEAARFIAPRALSLLLPNTQTPS